MTATCYTKHHGTHKIQIDPDKFGRMPDFGTVAIRDEQGDHKFDPRKDWDVWINSDIDPRVKLIKVAHFAGTVYIEESISFMKNKPKTFTYDIVEHEGVGRLIGDSLGNSGEKTWGPKNFHYHYEFSHSTSHGTIRITDS